MSAKIAKEWFRKHPKCVVADHWRWSELPQSSREFMGSTRTAEIRGNRVVFDNGHSELSLVKVEATAEDFFLTIKFGEHGWVSYRAA